MMLALSMMLLAATLFSDHVDCTVQGYVYKMAESDPVEFSRADSCTGVRTISDDKQIVLYSPHAWVRVLIQPDYGHRRFQYRWGAELAHVGPDTVAVQWGWTGKG